MPVFLAGFERRIAALDPQAFTVEVTAQVQSSPSQIKLNWPADTFATGYRVSPLGAPWQCLAWLAEPEKPARNKV